ncbi:MBL fold metallo-hydrolase [Paenibacillus agricola]|uniref:MBL fold metallo-hydrolase n=1 Tax=Paenibacillus agricola TaxID=2716264 RepID=A0ABX0JIV7_9BACL|nr:MBL fold metallo-hydrolase [Paenibacillus agricola]NHN35266.1 MBL fold metallo-hydrolase [Paenibacillus agricola]
MQIVKGIYQLAGQPYGVSSNTYAVLGQDSIVLVDCGTGNEELQLIEKNMIEWGLEEFPISHLLLTHSHFDHSGNAHVFRKKGTKVIAGVGDAEGIELGDERVLYYSYKQNFVPCRVDQKVQDGDRLQIAGLEFEVIHVPGHSRGSVVYSLMYKGKKIMFTGDTVMAGPNGQPKLGVTVAEDFNVDVYLQSLKKLSKLEADAVLGGHFQPCLQNATFLLRRGYRTGLIELRSPSIPTLQS